MTRRGTAVWVFGASVLLGAVVLGWISRSMLLLEGRESEAQARLQHEIAIGDVLWRMDTWLAPLVAQEAQRPVEDYLSFNTVPVSYTNRLAPLEPGQVLLPSPLLTYRSKLFPLHFTLDREGQVSSPQVPVGNELDVVQSAAPDLETTVQRRLMARLASGLRPESIFASCAQLVEVQPTKKVQRGWTNFDQRARSTRVANSNVQEAAGLQKAPSAGRPPGPLAPLWFDDAQGELLLFVRRAEVDGVEVAQGFVADWPALRTALLEEVADAPVASDATLVRASAEDATPRSRLLTAVPAALVTPAAASAARAAGWTPVCGLLGMAWLAFACVAATVGFTLRQALKFGERRARFAAAVAHELRTPLTTFRMYSELLAKDMVRDPDKRRDYFDTLQNESDRLARLVENVLGYARVEDGRFTAHREVIALEDLVTRHVDVLERRAAESDRVLAVNVTDPSARLAIDVEAVGQILFNLVDNACKYGDGPIEIDARAAAGSARIAVRDHGAGIEARDRARVFDAFDRGGHDGGESTISGVGLGLALARGLARDLGGDLLLEHADPGARFVLRLPVSG